MHSQPHSALAAPRQDPMGRLPAAAAPQMGAGSLSQEAAGARPWEGPMTDRPASPYPSSLLPHALCVGWLPEACLPEGLHSRCERSLGEARPRPLGTGAAQSHARPSHELAHHGPGQPPPPTLLSAPGPGLPVQSGGYRRRHPTRPLTAPGPEVQGHQAGAGGVWGTPGLSESPPLETLHPQCGLVPGVNTSDTEAFGGAGHKPTRETPCEVPSGLLPRHEALGRLPKQKPRGESEGRCGVLVAAQD